MDDLQRIQMTSVISKIAPRPPSKGDLFTRALSRSGLGQLLGALSGWQGVLAFAYHRIGFRPDWPFDRGLWSATPEAFDAQVRFLKKHFDLIGASDLTDVLNKQSGRFALITFDDGYRDNYEEAFPILRAHGAPATFFLATGYLDQPRVPWWDEIAWMVRRSSRQSIGPDDWHREAVPWDNPDRERAIYTLLRRYKSFPGYCTEAYLDFLAQATYSGRCPATEMKDEWMTWDMVREMAAAGMSIGGHTVNHPVLSRLTAEEQEEEVAGCARRLQQELGSPMRSFAYPNGKRDSFNQNTRDCLKRTGVEFSFSYYGGYQSFDAFDTLDIRRHPAEASTSLDTFRMVARLPQVFA
jgi:peptidoglycan/xylan/chitin deacetylase (PgdA/CDA1 family)